MHEKGFYIRPNGPPNLNSNLKEAMKAVYNELKQGGKGLEDKDFQHAA